MVWINITMLLIVAVLSELIRSLHLNELSVQQRVQDELVLGVCQVLKSALKRSRAAGRFQRHEDNKRCYSERLNQREEHTQTLSFCWMRYLRRHNMIIKQLFSAAAGRRNNGGERERNREHLFIWSFTERERERESLILITNRIQRSWKSSLIQELHVSNIQLRTNSETHHGLN